MTCIVLPENFNRLSSSTHLVPCWGSAARGLGHLYQISLFQSSQRAKNEHHQMRISFRQDRRIRHIAQELLSRSLFSHLILPSEKQEIIGVLFISACCRFRADLHSLRRSLRAWTHQMWETIRSVIYFVNGMIKIATPTPIRTLPRVR